MTPFEKIPQLLYDEWCHYASYTALWEQLAESRKSLIAKLASKQEWSETARDRLARGNPELAEYFLWVQRARHSMLNSKAKLAMYNAEFEYYRSMNATRRAEMNLTK